MDSAEYTKFEYPIYLAQDIIETGYTSVDEFKSALSAAAEKFTETVTLDVSDKL